MNLASALAVAFAFMQGTANIGIPSQYVPAAPALSTVVATVNGEPLSAQDVENLLWQWRGPEAVDELTGVMIVRQAAKKEGVVVTPAEIEKRLNEDLAKAEAAKKANAAEDPDPNSSEQDLLKQEGYPLSRLYLRAEIELTADKICLKTFKPEDFVKVSTIVVRTTGKTADDIAATAKKAQHIYQQMKDGLTWAAAVQESGASAKEVSNQGYVGWRKLSLFPSPLNTEIPTMKTGAITEPIQMPYGFQIFRIENLGKSAVGTELANLRQEYLDSIRPAYLAQLKRSAKVVVKLDSRP